MKTEIMTPMSEVEEKNTAMDKLDNYKRALDRKEEILETTQKALALVTEERDRLKTKLEHTLQLLEDICTLVKEPDFAQFELSSKSWDW
jgi:hypothetical protein